MTGVTAPRVRLADIASCFEGVIPTPICTCSRDGVPNITYLSIVHRLDEDHVALSVQFFNKTRRNVLENPKAQVLLVVPETMAQYRLDVEFERTEVSGPTFDYVRARLDAIASQSGMQEVFQLRGIDVYRVVDCRPVAAASRPADTSGPVDLLTPMCDVTDALTGCRDLDQLVNTALSALATSFGYGHSFLMVKDEAGTGLYTLASHGYSESGVGSEVEIGKGLIGTAAARQVAMRSSNLSRDRVLSKAIRDELARTGDQGRLEREIPLPGLCDAQSQVVVPLVANRELLGVLCVQSDTPGRFLAADEQALQIVGRHLAACLWSMGVSARAPAPGADVSVAKTDEASGAAVSVRYYQADDSIFVNDDYLIKGLPGRLLLRLLQAYLEHGRAEFTNRELRRDATLQLPDFNDNLEARLILLRRRLAERCEFLILEKAGRGRLHLSVKRPIRLDVLE